MLLKFWVQGYRCFFERTEIDFTDKKNYRFGRECVRGDLLDKVVILGNNGSGKTSFGYALLDITSTLTGFNKDVGQCNPVCFINGSGKNDHAVFHYEFAYHGSTVIYEYGKRSCDVLKSESLSVDRHVIFDYDLDDMGSAVFDLGSLGSGRIPVPELDGSMPLLRLIGDSVRLDPSSPVASVLEFARNSIYYMAMWKVDVHIGFMDEEDDIERFIVENGLVEELMQFLGNECGSPVRLSARDGSLMVDAGSKEYPFLQIASRGTAILCRLFCWNRRSRDKGAIMFFDDFDDLFDHRTAENVMTHIIRSSQAQCVFVTHNTSLFSSDTLRPDCCFIMKDGVLRSIPSLTDKSIRKGHNLEKMLRDGEFDSDLS